MNDTGKRYHIVDMSGNYYKLNEDNNLVVARDSSEATLFTIREANSRIGTGRKARFYNLIEAEVSVPFEVYVSETEGTYDAPELDPVGTPTMFIFRLSAKGTDRAMKHGAASATFLLLLYLSCRAGILQNPWR